MLLTVLFTSQEDGEQQQHYHIKGHHKHAGEQFREPEEEVTKPTQEQYKAAEKAYGMSQRVSGIPCPEPEPNLRYSCISYQAALQGWQIGYQPKHG